MGISRDKWHKRRATGGKQARWRKKRKFELGRPPANTKLGNKRIRVVRVRGGNKKYRAIRLDTGNFSWGSESVTHKTRIMDVLYNASNNELVRTKTIVKGCIIQIDATPFRHWYETRYGVQILKKKKTRGQMPEKEKDSKTATKETKKTEKLPEKVEKKSAEKVEKKSAEKVEKKSAEKVEKKSAEKVGKKSEKKVDKKSEKSDKKIDTKTIKKVATSRDKVIIKEKDKSKPSIHVLYKIARRRTNSAIDQSLEDQLNAGKFLAAISSRPGQCGRADGYILEGKELDFYQKKLKSKRA